MKAKIDNVGIESFVTAATCAIQGGHIHPANAGITFQTVIGMLLWNIGRDLDEDMCC